MPSLQETLRGHLRAGHEVVFLLPEYQLFADHPQHVVTASDDGYEVHTVPCTWAPTLLAARRLARRFGDGTEPPYVLRWLLNVSLCTLLTVSLVLAALKLRYRKPDRFDLVYAHNQYAAPAGWILGRMFGLPNVTRLYGTFLADLMNLPLVQLRYPVAAAGFLVPHALLICANDGTRGDQVARKLGIQMDRFRFWPNGVDVPSVGLRPTRQTVAARFPNAQIPLNRTWLLSCSRLSYWKRIDRILKALHFAIVAGCDCQLIIAGSGPEEERLRSLAQDLNIEPNVTWLGAVEHDAVWDLMLVGDVFMITNDVTNRCNPLFEAIRAGLPIVSVRDPSTADLLEHERNAMLAEKENVEQLGRMLQRVCSEPILASNLRQAQADRSKKFWSWQERMAEEVKQLESLVQKPPP